MPGLIELNPSDDESDNDKSLMQRKLESTQTSQDTPTPLLGTGNNKAQPNQPTHPLAAAFIDLTTDFSHLLNNHDPSSRPTPSSEAITSHFHTALHAKVAEIAILIKCLGVDTKRTRTAIARARHMVEGDEGVERSVRDGLRKAGLGLGGLGARTGGWWLRWGGGEDGRWVGRWGMLAREKGRGRGRMSGAVSVSRGCERVMWQRVI